MTGRTRVRYLAEVNPGTPAFDRLDEAALVTFMPLEAVWADDRMDSARQRRKGEVAAGYVRFQDGDVLVPKVTPTFQAGRVPVVTGLCNGVGAGSTELHVLRARPGVDPRYLAYAMRTSPFLTEGASAFQGVAGLQRVPDLFLRDFALPEFSLEEQSRIADFLDAQVTLLDQAVSLRDTQVALAHESLAARLDLLLRQGGHQVSDLVPAEYEPFGAVPKSWRQGRLRSTQVEVQTGPFGSQVSAAEYVDGGWPLVNPSNITREGHLVADRTVTVDDSTRGRLARHVLRVGDVVFGRRGDLGRAGLVTQDQDGWICGTGSLRVRFTEAAFDASYLTRFLRLPSVRYYFESNSVGSTMQNLNTSLLLGMPLLMPPIDEQREIAETADGLAQRHARVTELLTRSIGLLEERKKALITAAVTGEFDVTTARKVTVRV